MHSLLLPISTAGFGALLTWILIQLLISQSKKTLRAALTHFRVEHILPSQKLNVSLAAVSPFIDQQLELFFKNQLPQKMPMISMFIGEKTSQELKQVFKQELDHLFPGFIYQWGNAAIADWQKDHSKLNSILTTEIQKRTLHLYWIAILLGFGWGWLLLLVI